MNTVEPSSAQASGSREPSAGGNASAAESPSLESLVARVADEFLQRQRRGEDPAVEDYAALYPEAAGVLREVLAALCLVRLSSAGGSGTDGAEDPLAGCLGDFRLLREVGRGGMGVVYEAEQISLGRRVALKVLPLASTMDPRRLQRFHNEARAAACLHHTNIVPVFAVGSERGVHFFAMQLIEGVTLASLVRDLRQLEQPVQRSRIRQNAGTLDPHSGECGYAQAEPREGPGTMAFTPASEAITTALGTGFSSGKPGRDAAYFRKVAELGAKAAEALDYAHQMGVVHRDVKPGNLMLDNRGEVWITDFGLAQLQTEAGPTLTGDLVGTLRYMSPEQALAKRVPIDHRTDVYSLGATLYELLTLRPVFAGDDRQELLRQIAFEEPIRPRRLNRAIPSELETIVQKALEKNPADRYATAQELADDLQRFLKDEPIRARRPPLGLRLRKWGRRHKPVVTGLAVGLLTLLVVGAVLGVGYVRRLGETERSVTAALVQVETLLEEGDKQIDFPQRWLVTTRMARSALEKAEELLATGAATETLARRVEQVRAAVEAAAADSSLLVEFDRIRLEQALVKEGHFNLTGAAASYAKLLGDYGVDPTTPETAAARVRGSRIREDLLAALNDWLSVAKDKGERRKLEQILQAAQPPDAFRMRWGRAVQRQDVAALVKMAKDLPTQQLPSMALCGRAQDLTLVKEWAAAERLLREAQARKPGDFWLNHDLGIVILKQGRTRLEEAVGYLRAALALRSDSPGVHLNLGHALLIKGDIEGAIYCNQDALRIDPNYAMARCNLGYALYLQKKVDDAIASYREAIRLKPDLPEAHINLGVALKDKGMLDEAIAEFREALRIDKDFPDAHLNLAAALARKGNVDEAIDEFRIGIRLKPDIAEPHNDLGSALRRKGKVDEAIASYRQAIGLKKDYPRAHYNLGTALMEKGKPDEAIVEFRKAIGFQEDYPEAHNDLGCALEKTGKLDESISEFQKAIEFKKDFAGAHYNLGRVLMDKGKLDEAVAEFRKAIDFKKDYSEAYNELGSALKDKGKLDEAIAAYHESIRLKNDYAEAHCNLGNALVEKGQFKQAVQSLRLGHHLGSRIPGWPYPSAEWLRVTEFIAQLDKRLPAVLQGKDKPKDAAERLGFASLCQGHHKHFAAAARFLEEAFAEQPALVADVQSGRRYNAACAAALAAAGQGKDATDLAEKERCHFRKLALDWLRADLEAWSGLLKKQPDKVRPVLIEQMKHWKEDPDFAGVRGPQSLAKLPEAERPAWQKLWADVTDILGKAQGKSTAEKKPADK